MSSSERARRHPGPVKNRELPGILTRERTESPEPRPAIEPTKWRDEDQVDETCPCSICTIQDPR